MKIVDQEKLNGWYMNWLVTRLKEKCEFIVKDRNRYKLGYNTLVDICRELKKENDGLKTSAGQITNLNLTLENLRMKKELNGKY